jgi:hypothetical protein
MYNSSHVTQIVKNENDELVFQYGIIKRFGVITNTYCIQFDNDNMEVQDHTKISDFVYYKDNMNEVDRMVWDQEVENYKEQLLQHSIQQREKIEKAKADKKATIIAPEEEQEDGAKKRKRGRKSKQDKMTTEHEELEDDEANRPLVILQERTIKIKPLKGYTKRTYRKRNAIDKKPAVTAIVTSSQELKVDEKAADKVQAETVEINGEHKLLEESTKVEEPPEVKMDEELDAKSSSPTIDAESSEAKVVTESSEAMEGETEPSKEKTEEMSADVVTLNGEKEEEAPEKKPMEDQLRTEAVQNKEEPMDVQGVAEIVIQKKEESLDVRKKTEAVETPLEVEEANLTEATEVTMKTDEAVEKSQPNKKKEGVRQEKKHQLLPWYHQILNPQNV